MSKFQTGVLQDRRIFAQYGQDGIIEAIIDCLGVFNRYYVEFGAHDGKLSSNTRHLREHFNWTGLLMDGGFDDPSINLHKEWMTHGNIASLFMKHKVPQVFDLLTVDLDLNTFWTAHSLLRAGYRPRQVLVEINSNFATLDQSYVVLPLPESICPPTCYYGASPLAFTRLFQFYGYVPVAFEQQMVDMVFVHQAAIGGLKPPRPGSSSEAIDDDFNLEKVLEAMRKADTRCPPETCGMRQWHQSCALTTWLKLPQGVDYDLAGWMSQLEPVVLDHTDSDPAAIEGGSVRYAAPWVPPGGQAAPQGVGAAAGLTSAPLQEGDWLRRHSLYPSLELEPPHFMHKVRLMREAKIDLSGQSLVVGTAGSFHFTPLHQIAAAALFGLGIGLALRYFTQPAKAAHTRW